jgi:hypothetical protein
VEIIVREKGNREVRVEMEVFIPEKGAEVN